MSEANPRPTDARPGPLAGVRVLDLSRLVAGNMLTLVLADFGAEVVKLEPPGRGDSLRDWRVKGVSTYWKQLSRNKQSLGLDLRAPKAVEVLLRLVPRFDVLVENFRPGTLEAMGLGPDLLLARHPGLIVVRISGFGQDGPYRDRPGFGTLIEAMSGLAHMTGFPDREPVLPPVPLADCTAGLYGATAVLMALRHREVQGGGGQVIDLPLFDPLFSILGPLAANYRLTGQVKERTGSRSANSAPRNVYRTEDGGWIAISASMQGMAERLLRLVGGEALVQDPRFHTNSDRVANAALLDERIGAYIGAMTQAEALTAFDAADITAAPVYDIAQLIEDPYVKARGVVVDMEDPDLGRMPTHGVVPRLSATPGAIRGPAPALGADTRAVLREAGLTEAEIDALFADGAAAEPAPAPQAKAAR